jgi:hypothetical protein
MSGRAPSPARASYGASNRNNATRSRANNGILGKAARFLGKVCEGASCSRKKGVVNGNASRNNLGERYAHILKDNRELTNLLATARESERVLQLAISKLLTAAEKKGYRFRHTIRRTNGYNATQGSMHKNHMSSVNANSISKEIDRATITMEN